MHEYELIYILRPDLDDAAATALTERIEGVITGNNGIVLIRDDWGLKKMAYAIRKHQRGHYVQLNFLATADLIVELERNVRILDDVIRFLTSRVADAVDVPTRMREAKEELKRRAEERARQAEEAAARAAAEGEEEEEDEVDGDEDEDDDFRGAAL